MKLTSNIMASSSSIFSLFPVTAIASIAYARRIAPHPTSMTTATKSVSAVATKRIILSLITNRRTTCHTHSTSNIAISMSHAFRKIVNTRVSARRFQPNTPIPHAIWKDILSMTLTSPSGFNLQPTHIILLRDAKLKSVVSEHAMLGLGNKYRTIDASGIAVFCTDLMPGKRIDRIHRLENESGNRDDGYMAVMKVASSFLTGEGSIPTSNERGGDITNEYETPSHTNRISTFLKRTVANALSPLQPMPTMEAVESWSYKNAGIMSSIYTLAATSHGLSTCMMEGYDARRMKEILRVPDRFGIPLVVATGYEYCGVERMNKPEILHADFLNGEEKDNGTKEGLSRVTRRTPRLGMDELFFGDTFGEPLDFLIDKHSL